MKQLVILQTTVPDYRKKVFATVKEQLGVFFTLYAGDSYFEDSVQTDKSVAFLEMAKNHFLVGRKMLWQTGMWTKCIKTDVLVMELNPRIISNWVLLLLRKFTNKKTILWGHAWPRNGSQSKSDTVRHLMRLLADEIIVYTKTQQKELRIKMPHKKITAAPNAVYFYEEMKSVDVSSEEIINAIYVGRLTNAKKALFLVQTFLKFINEFPITCNLYVVGEGEQKEQILQIIEQHGAKNRVFVLGHVNDYYKLQELYSRCLFSVSPGYVGLSITQSFAFGVPMLISKNENHSPEIESVIEGENSIYFDSNDEISIKKAMVSFFNRREDWVDKRTGISKVCAQNYSVEVMASKFIDLV